MPAITTRVPAQLRAGGRIALLIASCATSFALGVFFAPHGTLPSSWAEFLVRCSPSGPDASAFASENNAAMVKMMYGMTIVPSGNIDRDFAAMMISHHQGAIDMAQAELRYGSNEQLRRIAQEIIVDQQQEIAAMNLALDQQLPPSAPAQTQTPRFLPLPIHNPSPL